MYRREVTLETLQEEGPRIEVSSINTILIDGRFAGGLTVPSRFKRDNPDGIVFWHARVGDQFLYGPDQPRQEALEHAVKAITEASRSRS